MDAVLWIVLGVLLAVAEMFTFVLIMLSTGAFAAAIAAALGAGVPCRPRSSPSSPC